MLKILVVALAVVGIALITCGLLGLAAAPTTIWEVSLNGRVLPTTGGGGLLLTAVKVASAEAKAARGAWRSS